MKKNLLLSLALCTVCATAVQAQTAASAIDGKKQRLYDSQYTPSTPYRIPAIATMGNNEVIAIADYRPCGADVGNGDVDIYARISANNGLTWSGTNTTYDDTEEVIKIADGGTGTSKGYGDAAVAADPNSGKVVVMCVGGGSTIFSSATTGTSDYLCIRNYSEDYGRTWTQANVTSYFKGSGNVFGADVASMFFGSGKLAVSKKVSGRIYGALLVRQGKSKLFGSYISYENKNYVVYSDDWGASWKLLGNGACCTGGDEPKVEELPNGDVLLSSRASGARYFNVFNFTDIESATGSWGTATSCSFAGSNSTNGEIMLYRNIYMVNDKSGTKYDVLLQSLPTGSSRSNVAVYYKAFATDKSSWAVSDFTSGWTKGIEVDNGASAYSTMTILPNGQIGFLYEDDYDTSKASGDYSNIVFVPLTVEEITGSAYTATAPKTTPTISLTAAATTLTIGETTQLTATTNSDGAVSYTSSNESVATVSTSGVVTAVAAGTVTITANVAATANYNAASATVTITVNAPVVTPVTPTISLTAAATTLTVGETTQLTATTNSDGAVTYTSSDESVATVSADGVVTAVAAGTATITANVAATANYNAASATVTITVNAPAATPVAMPTISPAGGEIEEGATVTISCATEGATIYYTTDGTAPTTASAVYSGAITVNSAMTIKAMATKEGNYTDSEVATARFTIKAREVVTTPVINPAGGEVEEGTAVTIFCATEGATIYYTTDGTAPTTASAVYNGAITVNSAMTIKAMAAKNGYYTNSAVATASFTIKATVTTEEYTLKPISGKIGNTIYYIATFSAEENTVLPSGVKAYFVKACGTDVVTLTRIASGKVIPAEQGVILMATSETEFTVTPTDDASNVADLTGNLMVASLDGVIPTGSYVLAVKGSGDLAGQFAFCLTSEELKLKSDNRAYLKLPSNAPQMRMRIEDESTDIEDSAQTSDEAPVIYDLTGRRVAEMLPGRIYIVNGKKIVN